MEKIGLIGGTGVEGRGIALRLAMAVVRCRSDLVLKTGREAPLSR